MILTIQMMPGTDDEFSDCDLDENENDDGDNSDTDEPTSSQPQPAISGASSQSSPPPPQWSSTLTPVSISDFTSPVGTTVAVPESPS